MGSGGDGRGPGREGEVCLPRAVLFGDLTFSEVRAYAVLQEAGAGGLTAAGLVAAMGLKDASNARKLLASLVAGGVALEGSDRKAVPGRRGPNDRSSSGGGNTPKRFVALRALDAPAAQEPAETAEAADRCSDPRTTSSCEGRGEGRSTARAAKDDRRSAPEAAPGGEPAEAAPPPRTQRKTYDTLTERCIEILAKVANFPANRANNARKIHEFRCTYYFANPVRTCEEYLRYHASKRPDHTKDHHKRLEKFFEVRHGDGARERGAQPLPVEADAAPHAGPEEKPAEKAPLPPQDPEAEAAKARLIDAISQADGCRRDNYFGGFVAPDLFPDGTLVLVCENEDYPAYIRKKWGPVLHERRVVVASSADYAEGSHLKPAGETGSGGHEPVRRAAG